MPFDSSGTKTQQVLNINVLAFTSSNGKLHEWHDKAHYYAVFVHRLRWRTGTKRTTNKREREKDQACGWYICMKFRFWFDKISNECPALCIMCVISRCLKYLRSQIESKWGNSVFVIAFRSEHQMPDFKVNRVPFQMQMRILKHLIAARRQASRIQFLTPSQMCNSLPA